MKRKHIIRWTLIVIIAAFLASGNTHRFLPEDCDPCQTDISHTGHVNELSMFHCIGHTEYEVDYEKEGLLRVKKWDHIHPWMTLDWHLKKGFSKEQAKKLLAQQ